MLSLIEKSLLILAIIYLPYVAITIIALVAVLDLVPARRQV